MTPQPKFNTGRKQGGLQKTYCVSYTVFLNCIREKNPYLCMLDVNAGNADTDFSGASISPALTPSSQSPCGYLCTIPSACSPMCRGRAGEGHLPYCLGRGSSAETSLSDLLRMQCRCTPGTELSAEFSGCPGG